MLEPFYMDYRKLRVRNGDGKYSIMYMDQYVDLLLNQNIVLDINLPRLMKRLRLEEEGEGERGRGRRLSKR